MNKRSYIIAFITCFLLCYLPICVVSIILGAIKPGSCDNVDPIGLSVSQYLIGSGVSSIIIIILMVTGFAIVLKDGIVSHIWLVTVAVVSGVFNIIWIIIGGIVLFRSNGD